MISSEEKDWMSKWMQDFWAYVKRYGDPIMDSAKAEGMIREANDICKRYYEDRRVISTMTGFINGVERMSR